MTEEQKDERKQREEILDKAKPAREDAPTEAINSDELNQALKEREEKEGNKEEEN